MCPSCVGEENITAICRSAVIISRGQFKRIMLYGRCL